jgi:ankyrin repeat protein
MKTLKLISLKTLINISLIVILLPACAQQSNDTEAASVIDQPAGDQPEVDIQTAVISGNLEAVKQHIKSGSDINQKDAFSSSTPLMSAAVFDKTDIAKALIDAGADLAIKNNDGSTALHSAAFFCRVEIVQMLIDVNADKTLLNKFGATPRETVMGPFAEIKPIYEMMQQQLSPFGLKLDMNELEKTRPVIVMMLQ